jgi:hypothetical protein
MAVARLQAGGTTIEHNDNTPTNHEPALEKNEKQNESLEAETTMELGRNRVLETKTETD